MEYEIEVTKWVLDGQTLIDMDLKFSDIYFSSSLGTFMKIEEEKAKNEVSPSLKKHQAEIEVSYKQKEHILMNPDKNAKMTLFQINSKPRK